MQYLAQVTQPAQNPPDVTGILSAMSGTALIVAGVVLLFSLLIWFMIIKRTGMNPWLCLLMLVPIANLIVLIVLAFSEWPIQREAKALRAQLAGGGTYSGPGYAPPPGYPPPPAPPYGSQLPPSPPPPATS
ncbi:MAG: hypothetical protein JO036_08780 [Candidatus Eremiobacteraeota bacterium]|nr:hypothetical protein [Candidatus Eremiobacteraeota bacterium]